MPNAGAENTYDPSDGDRELVRDLVTLGLEHPKICDHLNVSYRTLKECFPKELTLGSDLVNVEVMNALLGKCRQGDTKAIIFWLKSRAGWQDNNPGEDIVDKAVEKGIPLNIIVQGSDKVDKIAIEQWRTNKNDTQQH
jgi:hypothetical protein